MSDSKTKYEELKFIKNKYKEKLVTVFSIEDEIGIKENYDNSVNMANLPQPKTQVTEVLFMLLTRDSINVRQMMLDTGILNLTARISDLRNKYYIDVICHDINTKNKFERKIKYGKWILADKEHAKEVYLEILK